MDGEKLGVFNRAIDIQQSNLVRLLGQKRPPPLPNCDRVNPASAKRDSSPRITTAPVLAELAMSSDRSGLPSLKARAVRIWVATAKRVLVGMIRSMCVINTMTHMESRQSLFCAPALVRPAEDGSRRVPCGSGDGAAGQTEVRSGPESHRRISAQGDGTKSLTTVV